MKKSFLILGFVFLVSLLSAENYQAGDDNLLIMPTAYTMEAGQSYFSDYELLFIDYHVAVSSNMSIGCATLFPITTHFLETITIRARYKFIDLNKFKSALWAAFIAKPGILILGDVLSIGQKQTSFHAGLATVFDPNNDGKNVFIGMLGTRLDASNTISVFAEYTHTSSGINLSDDDFAGYLSFGLRFRGNKISWEIGGFRPMEENASGLLLLPIIKATIML